MGLLAKQPDPNSIVPKNSYISVVVPSFNRPFYLKTLLDSLEKHHDMNYEVIVHDDGSIKENQEEIFRMRDRISILSFNTYRNQGLAASSNHAVSLATSDYILFMNDDCFLCEPCFQDIANVLSRSYVGVLSAANGPTTLDEPRKINSTRFAVTNFLGGGSTIAFRKSVWQEVGGFDERSTSGQADNVFIYKIFKQGYWKALMQGPERIKVGNFVYGSEYKDTQTLSQGRDCCPTKLFPLTDDEHMALWHKRKEACQYWVDGERTIPNRQFYDTRQNPIAGLNDIPYWNQYFIDIFGGKMSSNISDINWSVAERHGQAKWKDAILGESK